MSQTEISPRAARRFLAGSDEYSIPRNEPKRTVKPVGSTDKPVSVPADQSLVVWEHLIARFAVRFGHIAWVATSDRGKATVLRFTSHVVLLIVILSAVSIANAAHPARSIDLAGRQANAGNSNEMYNLTFSAAPTTTQSTEENLNLVGEGGPILIDQATIAPQANPYTTIPNRQRRGMIQHTVQEGDTLFGIAAQYGLNPETVLWANYDALQDNPHLLKPGMVLDIPPVNGIVYTVEAGDTVESIAEKYKATVDAIYTDGYEWNQLKPGQQPSAGMTLIIPGGSREFKSWALTANASGPGVNDQGVPVAKSASAGFCKDASGGLVGTGTFIWPALQHWVSGNNYAPWHPGIDIAAHLGDPIYAADNGVVVYAGWNTWGYGNLVVIDHGNGWQTWYAHNSAIYVGCGQNVFQGSVIAAAGSTGRSTGPHLHFETRLNGTLPNPFNVLPPP